MLVEDLSDFPAGSVFETDLVIIGGGPAGLAIAREFFGSGVRALVIESGRLSEAAPFEALNAVESVGEPKSEAQVRRRAEFHGGLAELWSQETQPYGVRCRAFGGSSAAWAGKSAAFDAIDYQARPWVAHSGWPFGPDDLAPYLERAAECLNLGPNCYNDSFWDLLGSAPKAKCDPALLRSFFWQFARSRIDGLDVMRCGPEFLASKADNVRVLVNATATRIDVDDFGGAFKSLEISSIDGRRATVRAGTAVLAASGLENPRLLLLSNHQRPAGLGNEHDLVGRYLLDHPGARLGRFNAHDCHAVERYFGFYGVKHNGHQHMYMHGLTLGETVQRDERLLNGALYMLEDRAPDDPFDALKRLLRGRSENRLEDVVSIASSPWLLATGLGRRVLGSSALPAPVRDFAVDLVIKFLPMLAVREFQSRGLPHKLQGLFIDAIAEQRPNPESRVTLSHRRDALGQRLARVDWRPDLDSRRTLMRLGQLMAAELPRLGLPAPELEDWVTLSRPEDAVVIDMGHMMGATRMSRDPRQGVVDDQCRVHSVPNLYVAGSSVFPTGGHANPTLMILAMAIRLADRIKADLAALSRIAA
jgi:choline dehydrogenase-like flavoprotein